MSAADLSSLTRYEESPMEGGGVCPDRFGDYVKLTEVEALLASSAAPGRSGKLADDQHAWGRNMLMGIDIHAPAPEADSSSAAPREIAGLVDALTAIAENVAVWPAGRAKHALAEYKSKVLAAPSPTGESLSAALRAIVELSDEGDVADVFGPHNTVCTTDAFDAAIQTARAALATHRQTEDGSGLSAAVPPFGYISEDAVRAVNKPVRR